MQKEANTLFIKKLNLKAEIRMLVLLYQKQKIISFFSNSREKNKFSNATKNRIGRNVWN